MVQLTQEYSSDLHQLVSMRAFISQTCHRAWHAQKHEQALRELLLAVQEAATNIIRHAYGGEFGQPIELVIEVDDCQISAILYHEGHAFDPSQARPPRFDGSQFGGFGLYFIEQSVDDVQYFQNSDGRQGIRLTKYLDE